MTKRETFTPSPTAQDYDAVREEAFRFYRFVRLLPSDQATAAAARAAGRWDAAKGAR